MICNPLEIARIILNLRRWIYNVQLYHLSVFPYERSWLWPGASALQIVQRSDPPLQTASPPSRFHPHENTACCKDRGRSLTRREMWNKFTWPRRRWKDSSPRGKFLRKNPKPFRFKRKKKKQLLLPVAATFLSNFFTTKKQSSINKKNPSSLPIIHHCFKRWNIWWLQVPCFENSIRHQPPPASPTGGRRNRSSSSPPKPIVFGAAPPSRKHPKHTNVAQKSPPKRNTSSWDPKRQRILWELKLSSSSRDTIDYISNHQVIFSWLYTVICTPINQSTNQSTNQPTNQPINQSTNQPINQSTSQLITLAWVFFRV